MDARQWASRMASRDGRRRQLGTKTFEPDLGAQEGAQVWGAGRG